MRLHPTAWVAIMGTLIGSGYLAGTAFKDEARSETGADRRVTAPSAPLPSQARSAAPLSAPVQRPPMITPDSADSADSAGSTGSTDSTGPADEAARTDQARQGRSGDTERSRAPGGPSRPLRGTAMHVPLNAAPADRARAARLGYNLFDVGPSASEINALPPKSRALIWVGNSTCGAFSLSYNDFTAAVRRLAGNPRVYGWYLSDEPNTKECPGIVAEIRKRADYIKQHAPRQRSFASLTDWPLKPLRPAASHLDLIGLDPYPCRIGQARCDMGAIAKMYRQARRAGFRRNMIVPVFQTFGQTCSSGEKAWRLPSVGELRTILKRWNKLAPNAPFDISYSWARQGQWACPSLSDADGRHGYPDLQAVMRVHNLTR